MNKMNISVRWVDNDYTISEAIALVELPDTFPDTLVTMLKDVFTSCNLSLASCHGQAYSGATNMQGI